MDYTTYVNAKYYVERNPLDKQIKDDKIGGGVCLGLSLTIIFLIFYQSYKFKVISQQQELDPYRHIKVPFLTDALTLLGGGFNMLSVFILTICIFTFIGGILLLTLAITNDKKDFEKNQLIVDQYESEHYKK